MQQETTKKSYETPVLAELGNVQQLTQGVVKEGSCIGPIELIIK